MAITEDDLATAEIQFCEENIVYGHDSWESNFFPEVHYNYYGTRGVADLYIHQHCEYDIPAQSRGWVIEFKSESAVKQATGANEIIRQFNRMREHFYKGSSYEPPDLVGFQLVFSATDHNIRHIFKNIELYNSVAKQGLPQIDADEGGVAIKIAHPDQFPSLLITQISDGRRKHFDSFSDYVSKENEVIYRKHTDLIDEVSDGYNW